MKPILTWYRQLRNFYTTLYNKDLLGNLRKSLTIKINKVMPFKNLVDYKNSEGDCTMCCFKEAA